jgi:hypothetical protein
MDEAEDLQAVARSLHYALPHHFRVACIPTTRGERIEIATGTSNATGGTGDLLLHLAVLQ